MKPNYVVIPLITIAVALAGSHFTNRGMAWYQTLKRPALTPPGAAIGAVWTVLYVLATLSALVVWNTFPRNERFGWIVGLFLVNAFLNGFWSYLFFGRALIGPALVEMIALLGTVVALMVLTFPGSKAASGLLIPYAAWVTFATYLTVMIWRLNS